MPGGEMMTRRQEAAEKTKKKLIDSGRKMIMEKDSTMFP